jgi:hypothetical protein
MHDTLSEKQLKQTGWRCGSRHLPRKLMALSSNPSSATKNAGGMAQVAKHVLSKCGTLNLNPSTAKNVGEPTISVACSNFSPLS